MLKLRGPTYLRNVALATSRESDHDNTYLGVLHPDSDAVIRLGRHISNGQMICCAGARKRLKQETQAYESVVAETGNYAQLEQQYKQREKEEVNGGGEEDCEFGGLVRI